MQGGGQIRIGKEKDEKKISGKVRRTGEKGREEKESECTEEVESL